MRIKKPRTHTYISSFLLVFSLEGNRSFSFECDGLGRVDLKKMNPTLLASYQKCLLGPVVSREILDYSKWVHEPAIGECNRCGSEVYLCGFTNTCECGADYNMSGEELASRSQWGEETGESLSEILNIR